MLERQDNRKGRNNFARQELRYDVLTYISCLFELWVGFMKNLHDELWDKHLQLSFRYSTQINFKEVTVNMIKMEINFFVYRRSFLKRQIALVCFHRANKINSNFQIPSPIFNTLLCLYISLDTPIINQISRTSGRPEQTTQTLPRFRIRF